MNKITKLVFGVVLLGLIVFVAVNTYKNKVVVVNNQSNQNLGNLFVNENAYGDNNTIYSTTTLVRNVATLILSRATSTRNFAKICHLHTTDALNAIPTSTVFLYKQSTSTGVNMYGGIPIYIPINIATTVNRIGTDCVSFNFEDPYIGEVWGIANATATTLSIEANQN